VRLRCNANSMRLPAMLADRDRPGSMIAALATSEGVVISLILCYFMSGLYRGRFHSSSCRLGRAASDRPLCRDEAIGSRPGCLHYR
jgi:hypothetical protein